MIFSLVYQTLCGGGSGSGSARGGGGDVEGLASSSSSVERKPNCEFI